MPTRQFDRSPPLPVAPPLSTAPLLTRYRAIATVLIRHGFADVVDLLRLGPSLTLGTRLLPKRARPDLSRSRAERFRLALEELGPTFVKLGQALSMRADVLPPEVIDELSKLQDRVAPLAPGQAEAAIEAELGRPASALFARFDAEPVAAASIAQVHDATLIGGEHVAVKVRRPGIEDVIARDLEILHHLARLIERHVAAADVIDPVGLVDEFARTIRAELDLTREGRNITRLARAFADDPTVRFPRVYDEYSTAGVLTLEFLDGVKVTSLEAAGVDTATRRAIACRGADAMLRQILVHGVFHADPHPGNLVVLPGQVVGFLDFGIVGRVDSRLREQLAAVIRAVGHRDARRLTTIAIDIAGARFDVDEASLERDLGDLIDTYGDVPLSQLSMSAMLTDVIHTAARHRLRIPSNLLLLIKAVMTIEAVGRVLDPSFKMVAHAAPLAEQLWGEHYSPAAIADRVASEARRTAAVVGDMPFALGAILRKVQAGRVEVQFVHRNLEHFVREMDRSSNRLSFAVVIAALIIGSSTVIQAGVGIATFGVPILGLAGFFLAGVLGIGLAIGIMRSGRL